MEIAWKSVVLVGGWWTPARKMKPPMPVIAIPMVIPAAVVVYTEELAFRVVTSKDGLRLLDARSSPIQPKS